MFRKGNTHIIAKFHGQGFPLGLLNESSRDSLCGVKGSLIMIQGFVVLKKLKLLPIFIILAF